MSEIGTPDSLVRGMCVFLGSVCGVAMAAWPQWTPGATVAVFVLALVAANYVIRPSRG